MKRFEKLAFIIFIFVITPVMLYWGPGWKVDDQYDTYEEVLTLAGTATGASDCDTTQFFPGNRFMEVIFKPAGTANGDSFHATDSVKVRYFIQGWSDKSNGVCLGNICLWSPFAMRTSATASNFDSSHKTIDMFMGSNVSRANYTSQFYTAGTGDWDSSRITLRKIDDNTGSPKIWPWVRIIVADSSANLAGKGYKAKVKIVGYTP